MSFYDKKQGGLLLHTSTLLEDAGAIHAFTTRPGGVSEGVYSSLNLARGRGDEPERVRENYRRVCAALGVDIHRMVSSCQIHTDVVRNVTEADIGKGLDREVDYECDGLVTDIPGVPLTVFGADCLTVLLYDPVRQVIGAVHAGWRGTALGIVGCAVEKMKSDYGCDPRDVLAAIGPGISRCCFETDEDVPKAMLETYGDGAAQFVDRLENGKYKVDLKGLNLLRLKLSGVVVTNVDTSPDCTMCHPEKYWSHRTTGGRRGSQASLICLREKTR